MAKIVDKFERTILHEVSNRRSETFSGIGIVFYEDLSNLPRIPLMGPDTMRPGLPISDTSNIVSTLASTANKSSRWHDGFHFVDYSAQSLTHLSQFLSPPLTATSFFEEEQWPSGARQATAIMASLVIGIKCVGLIRTDGKVIIYRDGKLLERE